MTERYQNTLLNATINHHLKIIYKKKKTFVDKFLEDLYLDDSTIGVKILEEGEAFYKKAKSIFQKAGPGLGKWITDSTELQLYFEERKL